MLNKLNINKNYVEFAISKRIARYKFLQTRHFCSKNLFFGEIKLK